MRGGDQFTLWSSVLRRCPGKCKHRCSMIHLLASCLSWGTDSYISSVFVSKFWLQSCRPWTVPVPFTSRPRRFLVLSLSLIACCFLKQKQMDTERLIWLQEMCVKGPVKICRIFTRATFKVWVSLRRQGLRIFGPNLATVKLWSAGGEAGEAYCEGSCQANPWDVQISKKCRSPELCSSNLLRQGLVKTSKDLECGLGFANSHFITRLATIFGKNRREILFYKMHLDSWRVLLWFLAFFLFHFIGPQRETSGDRCNGKCHFRCRMALGRGEEAKVWDCFFCKQEEC